MHRRGIAAIVLVLASVVGAYFLGRGQLPSGLAQAGPEKSAAAAFPGGDKQGSEKGRKPSTSKERAKTSLPPPDTPLKDILPELQARANAGDAAAATRLYRNVGFCSRLGALEQGMSRLADELLSEKVDGMDPAHLDSYQDQLNGVEQRRHAMQKLHGLCDGVGADVLDSLVPDLKRAADLGDELARACYIKHGPSIDMRSIFDQPTYLNDYRSSVHSMIESGIAAGDWKVVDILREAYQPGAQSILAGLLGRDPVQYYRYLKLYRMGAEPYRVDKLDQQLASAAAALTPKQIDDADTWAQSTLQKNFTGASTEQTLEGWDGCSFDYE